MTLEDYAARLAKRAPVTTSRTELLQLPTGWALLAVPSERVLETWDLGEEATARRVSGLVAAVVARQRLYATRPYGTCSRCAEPLDASTRGIPEGLGYCPACQAWVHPAGPRVGTTEQALRDQQKAAAAAAVDRLRGKPPA